MEEVAPNARLVNREGSVDYRSGVGGRLKIRFKAEKRGSFYEFSPANLHVWFNDAPITFLQRLELIIDDTLIPSVSMTFTLDDVDIDTDSLLALAAVVKQREAVEDAIS